MLFVNNLSLPRQTLSGLDQYQAKVDGAGDYASQVKKGKKLFPRYNSSKNATFKKIRKRLKKMCPGHHRCVYCEDSKASEIEHVKPKDLYPEKAFRWCNYIYVCSICNRTKGSKFAVISKKGKLIDVTRKRNANIIPPVSGLPAFVNPRLEDPLGLLTMDLSQTFAYSPRPNISPIDCERALFTIQVLNMNGNQLPDSRRNAFEGYKARLSYYVQQKMNGVSSQELDRIREDLLCSPHPTVWEEMKNQADLHSEIAELFETVPEAKGWEV